MKLISSRTFCARLSDSFSKPHRIILSEIVVAIDHLAISKVADVVYSWSFPRWNPLISEVDSYFARLLALPKISFWSLSDIAVTWPNWGRHQLSLVKRHCWFKFQMDTMSVFWDLRGCTIGGTDTKPVITCRKNSFLKTGINILFSHANLDLKV